MERLEDLGCQLVIFEGGEPLLWQDGGRTFADIAVEAGRRFLRTGVVTNGTVRLESKTDLLWVSLDGPRDIHNALRDNSWGNIMRNLESTRHKRVYVHCTINRANVGHLGEFAAAVSSLRNVRGVTFQFFYPYNEGELDLSLSREERKLAVRTILGVRRDKGVRILNSPATLKRMVDNNWKCREWLLANVHPDGTVSNGCYILGRGEPKCGICGFTPVAEISGAYGMRLGAIRAGLRIFG
jgi:MoaA/NifB/PqqE/SkfB family radical SAM enzyme